MTTQQDVSIGFGKESVYGTAVPVDHFFEFLTETLDWNPTWGDASGMRVGRVVKASDRRVLVKEEANGDVELEVFQKGMGYLFNAALGNATSTNITGAAYQQLITPTTSDYLPSYTCQVGVPTLGAGPQQPQTYEGLVVDSFDLKGGNAGIPSIKFSFLGQTMSTSTGYATPSYIASNTPWSFVQGAITIGGTLTLPTATTLTTGGTSVANIRDFDLQWKNNLDKNGFNYGGAGQRIRAAAMGERDISGTITAEYDSNIMRDAYRNQTDLAMVLTFKSLVAITGANYPTLQITIPDVRLNGQMPQPNKGDVIAQSIPFEGFDNRTAASPIYVAIVTTETAL